jgi:hypothetical protein
MCAGGLLVSHDLLLRHGINLAWCLQFGDRVAVRGAEALDDGELVAVQTET